MNEVVILYLLILSKEVDGGDIEECEDDHFFVELIADDAE